MQTPFPQPQNMATEPKAMKYIRLAAVIFAAASIVNIFGNCIYSIILCIEYSRSISVSNEIISCVISLFGLIPAFCTLFIGIKKNLQKSFFSIAKIAVIVCYAIAVIVRFADMIRTCISLGVLEHNLLEICFFLNFLKSAVYDILFAVFYIAFFGFFENLSSLCTPTAPVFGQAPVMTSPVDATVNATVNPTVNAYEPFAASAQAASFNQAAAEPSANGFGGQNTAPGDLFVDPSAYREMIVHILLCLFTCGIWSYVWIYKTTGYLNRCPDELPENPTSKLLLCMFIPFYQIYWIYKHAQRIDKMTAAKFGIQEDNSTVYLILALFIPVVALILMQDKINKLCRPANGMNIG